MTASFSESASEASAGEEAGADASAARFYVFYYLTDIMRPYGYVLADGSKRRAPKVVN